MKLTIIVLVLACVLTVAGRRDRHPRKKKSYTKGYDEPPDRGCDKRHKIGICCGSQLWNTAWGTKVANCIESYVLPDDPTGHVCSYVQNRVPVSLKPYCCYTFHSKKHRFAGDMGSDCVKARGLVGGQIGDGIARMEPPNDMPVDYPEHAKDGRKKDGKTKVHGEENGKRHDETKHQGEHNGANVTAGGQEEKKAEKPKENTHNAYNPEDVDIKHIDPTEEWYDWLTQGNKEPGV
ncbi:MAG: hypothetical protein M1833_005565 [Piccolia ochrophora]|nr:MAG: hypothetical protein M1833_005565 [Piccolia ochrophora]